MENFNIHKCSTLLLVHKNNSYGLEKINGDFILKGKKIIRYVQGNEIIFYSGLQILNIATLNNFSKKKFSINLIWDILINQEKLYGEIMQSDWFHIGDLKGLSIAKKLCT